MYKKLFASLGMLLALAITFMPVGAALAATNEVPIGKTNAAAIDAYVKSQAQASRLPSASVAIVQGTSIVHTTGTGGATPDTAYLLASLSKPITALAVMQLVDQGNINLDATVQSYIPWFQVGNKHDSDRITVRQLLSQSGGLSTAAGQTALSFKSSETLEQAIRGLKDFPLAHVPGKQFEYSNANYMILGYLVEQRSGQSYNDYVSQHIFAPLDMNHSYASPGVPNYPDVAKGHVNWFGFKSPLTENIAPALIPDGFVISTVNDMGHFLIAQMNDGVYNGKRVISSASLQLMHTTAIPMPQDYLPNNDGYALGWGTGTVNGDKIISHDGQLHDFQTNMGFLPDQKTAVIVLINQYGLLTNDSQIYEGILDGITKGSFPELDYTYYIVYGTLDVVVLVALWFMIRSAWKLRKWPARYKQKCKKKGVVRATLYPLLIDLGLALLVYVVAFYGLGFMSGTVPLNLTLMSFALPDITVCIVVLIAFFLLRAVAKALLMVYARRHHASA